MNIDQLFPGKHLRASDLQGEARRVIIQNVTVEEVAPGETKPVIFFSNAPKALVLNRTNAMILASFLGPETTAWTGHEVEIYPDRVGFQGRIVPAVRVRQPVPPSSVSTLSPQQAESTGTAAEVTTENEPPVETVKSSANSGQPIDWGQ